MEEENNRISWPNLFIKVIIVVIFILFTVWLLSLSHKGLSNSLNVLTDNIYAENIDRMKEVGSISINVMSQVAASIISSKLGV